MENGKERITKEVNDKLDIIIGKFFEANRYLDRGMPLYRDWETFARQTK